ncbi:UDP-N-acetylglucosamine--N-acetylmuramyl- (pentapeptide) pyrophosphoryl-undecaprenol N-acetylglucosamine transferase [Acaryochloris thomasi RCC1774]|uniref:UDP-N-acetylglucosamine--N-acetylmuramyl-(Pentapeptide) pyrophosphoryl-undecaprenol N-acetylglucosamine transferase n=1 Tax=Acaryochloris thomasi RCC1774 TaxID=1764569 RepID=A0A2W1JJ27_9CYAN|nr:glycosyltransferase [Acaryochloris thomasi]PZD73470.1 UDP-N-acetylglucosamine--N-acetylmuramyl- (pentapeptide) pyrophosphoryl-undecaprenol N-acetylglucosamine transferase [Acaryochloris thomasi RCC1774]
MRLMVYSHDAFGLGNLRRMLAICEHLLQHWQNLSILLVSGSPMLQGFRLPEGLDYIKLPCLSRGVSGDLSAKYLKTTADETIVFRSHLILSAAKHFKPDLLLVDKKPYGIQQELAHTLAYMERKLPQSKCVLLLRDILDAPEKMRQEWLTQGYYQAIQVHYDQVLVVGMPEVFDLAQEYQFPLPAARKVRYCGYIRKPFCRPQRFEVRRFLRLSPAETLVLVTPGGGEDGLPLVEAYLQGLRTIDPAIKLRSLILCGPEMPVEQQAILQKMAEPLLGVTLEVFTDNLLGYLSAADVVVAMGGYNTLTEILALNKRAVVVPRTSPSQEQLIRMERFMQRGLVQGIHPEVLTPRSLLSAVLDPIDPARTPAQPLNFGGLPQISHYLSELVSPSPACPLTGLLTV